MMHSPLVSSRLFVVLFALLMLAWTPVSVQAEEPYHETQHWKGLTGGAAWHLAPGGVGCTETTCGSFDDGVTWAMTFPDSVETLIVEVVYEPELPTHVLRLDLICPDGEEDSAPDGCAFSADQGPHLRIRVDRADVEAAGLTFVGSWLTDVAVAEALGAREDHGVDAGVVFEEKYDLYLSTFHYGPAPDGFSAVPS